MSTGCIGPNRDGVVEVAVQRIAGDDPRYIIVNKRSDAIVYQMDEGERHWPQAEQYPRPMRSVKVGLFFPIYLLSSCDFLPAVLGIPFFNMW